MYHQALIPDTNCRYNSAVRQTQGSGSAAKAENIRDEMEEASQKMEQCRVK